MSTGIKDKPLKKIVCDTRTTIDNIHTKKLQYLKKEILILEVQLLSCFQIFQ